VDFQHLWSPCHDCCCVRWARAGADAGRAEPNLWRFILALQDGLQQFFVSTN
jgi:hypothetical protein